MIEYLISLYLRHLNLIYLYIGTLYSTDGLAWDWINQKLYWTDQCNDRIEVYDPSASTRKVLIETGTNSNPRGIVVDPVNG